MPRPAYPPIARLRTPEQFAERLRALNLSLDFDPGLQAAPDSPLAWPYSLVTDALSVTLSNRWCILPMEGWDATADGRPTDLTFRRWERFGASGAKLIWGGEAVAVSSEGRAHPRQLVISEETLADLARLREHLVAAHAARWRTDDLLVGLQLTHSGRYSYPRPLILYHHPILDRRLNLPADYPLLSDGEIERIIEDFVRAARLAQRAGFAFVDIKHCHGYLGHEFLSAVDRPGKFGGSFHSRTRFLREIVAGIRAEAPGLEIGVRLSAFDFVPFRPGPDGVGEPEIPPGPPGEPPCYPYAFGGDGSGLGIDLTEPHQFLDLCETLGIRLVNITAGNPYSVPHIQRPALRPPAGGYWPPEDPLVGVARLIRVTAELRARHPGLCFVGSGYSYLQEWLPHVAQNAIRTGKVDFVGLGRIALAYPELCADVLEGRPLQRRRLCRTCSDCTTSARRGLPSGCYLLDPFYRHSGTKARSCPT